MVKNMNLAVKQERYSEAGTTNMMYDYFFLSYHLKVAALVYINMYLGERGWVGCSQMKIIISWNPHITC